MTVRADPEALRAAAHAAVAQGDRERAIELLGRATAAAPKSVDARLDLGQLLLAAGRSADAESALREAVQLERDAPMPRLALAFALTRNGKLDEAAAQLRKLLERHPGHADAWFNLGNVHRSRGALDDAARCFARAAALQPANPDAAVNLGLVLAHRERFEEAASALERYVAQGEPSADVLLNLGQVRRALGAPAAAREAFDAALRIAPDHLGARVNRAIALWEAGSEAAAEAEARAIVGARPGCAEARFLIATLCLATGRFEEGWREYRWRPDRLRALGDTPLPSTDSLRGARVVLRGEQGPGDVLFFLRYAPALRSVASAVQFGLEPRLAAILPSDWGAGGAGTAPGAPHDSIVLLPGDLPALFGPAPIPSLALTADPERVAAARARLAAAGPPPFVGVTWEAGTRWSAHPRPGETLYKRIDPERLGRALAAMRGSAVILQRNPSAADIDAFQRGLGREVIDHSAANAGLSGALVVLGALDDYVGVSNTNFHLRAALGRSGRVLVTRPAEWRWMAAGERSPWFPEFALYRETAAGWDGALGRLARDLGA
jgi:tetratricopeptide (TPR) repeat protein